MGLSSPALFTQFERELRTASKLARFARGVAVFSPSPSILYTLFQDIEVYDTWQASLAACRHRAIIPH
jgi:hypothetical protein